MNIRITAGASNIDEEGLYPARLVSYEEEKSKFDPEKDQFRLRFAVTEGDFKDEELTYWVNIRHNPDGTINAGPKSNLYKLLAALNGVKELSTGSIFDLDKLIGNVCMIDVVEKNDFMKIADVRPMKKRGTARDEI